MSEVIDALMGMKSGKAPDRNRFTMAFVKALG